MNEARLALFALLPFFVGIHSFGQASPMFRGDPGHSGIYAGAGVPEFHRIRWSFHTNGEVVSIVGIKKLHSVGSILSSPVVSGRAVFLGTSNGNLYALQ